MTKWEYASVPLIPHVAKEILDNWGEDGWELVAVMSAGTQTEHQNVLLQGTEYVQTSSVSNATNLVAYFKRPKQG